MGSHEELYSALTFNSSKRSVGTLNNRSHQFAIDSALSPLTLLVRQQEMHSVCKNLQQEPSKAVPLSNCTQINAVKEKTKSIINLPVKFLLRILRGM